MQPTPTGLPVSPDDTLQGRDIIGGKGINRATQRNRLDLYRYDTHDDAQAATRRVRVTVYIPNGVNANCPK
jgi:hypothetical protein